MCEPGLYMTTLASVAESSGIKLNCILACCNPDMHRANGGRYWIWRARFLRHRIWLGIWSVHTRYSNLCAVFCMHIVANVSMLWCGWKTE